MMKKLQNYLLIGVFIMTALLVAVAGLRAYSGYMEKKAEEEALFQQRKEEILARNAEAQNRVQEMEVEIIQWQEDVENLQAFIDETVNAANEVQRRKEAGIAPEGDVSASDASFGNDMPAEPGSISGDDGQSRPGSISENDVSGQPGTISGNGMTGQSGFSDSVSGNDGSDLSSVSGNQYDGPSVSGNSVSGNSVSGNSVSGNGDITVSGNDDFGFLMGSISENDADVNYYDGNMTSDSVFDEWRPIYEQSDMTLEERKELRTSYQETLEVNQADREWIAENQYDFSQMKIACLGDSITKAVNLEDEENYEQYAYPARLQELLGAQEVYNLGIGGSSIGRYWADAFVDRYMEIPEDSDIIIVMGGTNDGFCVSDEEFGSLEEREYHTFCGDLDELMRGLRKNYPAAQIFFATPLPNVLQDYLMSERDYLLPQKKFVEVIQVLADEYDFELIDLYNSNVLDSHDANIIREYMPDGVHGNHEGYQILAEHFAGEIVKYYNEDVPDLAEENVGEDGLPVEGVGADAGTNAGAVTGVRGNAGANVGAATVISGNVSVNGGNYGTGAGTDDGYDDGTGGETVGADGTDSGPDGSGTESSEDAGADGTDAGADGEQTGTDAGADGEQTGTDAGTDGEQTGTDTGADGEQTGTDVGTGEDAMDGTGGGMDAESGANGGAASVNDGIDGAGADKGIGTEDRNDVSSERRQYRYEY